MSGYDNWLLRGSGAFSTEREVTLPEPCKCGSIDGMVYVDDFGIATLTCAECEIEVPMPEDAFEPDHDWHDERYDD